MGNHGALTVGATLAAAYQRVPYLEYVCEVHLRALSIVLPVRTLPPEEVALVAEQLSLRRTRAAKLTTSDHSFRARRHRITR